MTNTFEHPVRRPSRVPTILFKIGDTFTTEVPIPGVVEPVLDHTREYRR